MALELSQRFRRQVAPFDVVHSLTVVAGPGYCPALQTIRTDGTPNISREGASGAPTLIASAVSAYAKDSSGSVESVTDSAVTNVRWMVQRGDEAQGTDITLHPSWTGKFTVGTGEEKGRLYVRMNIPAGTTWKIWMECVISDQRRGYTVAIPVVTDSVLLYSIANAGDKYTMSIDRPGSELYDPALDERLIHEYLTGLGLAHTLEDDDKTYLRTVHAALRKGGEPLDSGYTVRVFSVSASGTRTEATASTDDCIASISGGDVTFDLRFAESMTYQIACFAGSAEVAHKTYGWAWSGEMPTTDEGLVGGSTYSDSDRKTYRPKFNLGKSMLQYPAVAFDMEWYYRNLSTGLYTYVGGGEQHTYDIGSIPMLNGEAEVVLRAQRRGAFAHLSDASGNRYTDGGDYLIEN